MESFEKLREFESKFQGISYSFSENTVESTDGFTYEDGNFNYSFKLSRPEEVHITFKDKDDFIVAISENNGEINEEFLLNLADFSKKCCIIKDNSPNSCVNKLKKLYSTVYSRIIDNETYIIAINKIISNTSKNSINKYINNNRGAHIALQKNIKF